MKAFRPLMLGFAALITALAVLPAACASIVTIGDFQTGTPTPTFSIDGSILLSVTDSGSFSYLVLDEWINSDGTRYDLAPSPVGQTISYRINDGPAETLRVSFITDTFNGTAGAFTPNDGYLAFSTPVTISAGDRVTILPSSLTFSHNAAFNPPPAVFNGNVFLVSFPGALMSNYASVVPEPSTWALLSVGAVIAGVVARRQRRKPAAPENTLTPARKFHLLRAVYRLAFPVAGRTPPPIPMPRTTQLIPAMFLRHAFATVCLLAVSLSAASSAAAQTVINSVPYTITVSGKYVLGNNVSVSSASQVAITVSVANVILDLNGFFVSGPGSTFASSTPVISVGNVANVTIRNGTVANNGYGIFFATGTNSINHLVENLRITRCYIGGIYFSGTSATTVVRNNTVSQTGGSTISPNSYAMYSNGGVRFEGNFITGVTNTGLATGIDANTGDFIVNNTISTATNAVRRGKYRDNLTDNISGTPFSLGTDAGGNN